MKILPASLPASFRASLVIILLIIALFAFNAMRSYLTGDAETAPQKDDVFSVIAMQVTPQPTGHVLTLKGITAASKTVIIRAETPGQVTEIPAIEGTLVKSGDVLCRLAIDSRQASTAEARAALQKAQLDYEAAVNLSEQGFQSSAGVANAKAAFDRAKAGVNRSSLDLQKTRLTPPFAGILTQYFVDTGDFLAIGSPCAEIKTLDPIKVIATVSEKDVKRLSVGSSGTVEVGHETLDATVSFVAKAANPATRTFTIELEAANLPGWRDGQTALAMVTTGQQNTYRLPRNALVLNDEGILGIRITAPPDPETGLAHVRFMAVDMIDDDERGVYVTNAETGSAPAANLNPEKTAGNDQTGNSQPDTGQADRDLMVITRGQNYVRHGQIVKIAREPAAAGGGALSGN